MQALDANMIGGIAPATREVLQRVAVVGASFDTDEFVALSGLPEDEAFDHLDARARRARSSSPRAPATASGTGSSATRCSTTCRRTAGAGSIATPPSRLIELARVGRRASVTTCSQSGATADAVPYLLRAAETEAAVGAYRDALVLVDAVRPHATGARPRARRCRCAPTCSTRSATRWRCRRTARRSTAADPAATGSCASGWPGCA